VRGEPRPNLEIVGNLGGRLRFRAFSMSHMDSAGNLDGRTRFPANDRSPLNPIAFPSP
jgi:hypothetical protein